MFLFFLFTKQSIKKTNVLQQVSLKLPVAPRNLQSSFPQPSSLPIFLIPESKTWGIRLGREGKSVISGNRNDVEKLNYFQIAQYAREGPATFLPHYLGNPEIANPRRLALIITPMGTVLLGTLGLRLYICLHTHISIYVYIIWVREYINSYATLYEQFLYDSDNRVLCIWKISSHRNLFCFEGISTAKRTQRRFLIVVSLQPNLVCEIFPVLAFLDNAQHTILCIWLIRQTSEGTEKHKIFEGTEKDPQGSF